MRVEIGQQLRRHTADVHARVEAGLDLLDPGLSADRMRAVLARFAGFWGGTEPVIDSWAANPRAGRSAVALSWPRRRRTAAFAADLRRLGVADERMAAVPLAPPVLVAPGEAEVLGWLYVSEGSTLGGAVIHRALRRSGDPVLAGLRSFTPYEEGPGPMWRGYLAHLDTWVGQDGARSDRVVAAAVATFDALHRWLAPITAQAADRTVCA